MSTTKLNKVEKQILSEINELRQSVGKTYQEEHDTLNKVLRKDQMLKYIQGGKVFLESQLSQLAPNIVQDMKTATTMNREVVVNKNTLPGSLFSTIEEKCNFVDMISSSEELASALTEELYVSIKNNPLVTMVSDFVVVLKDLTVNVSSPVMDTTRYQPKIVFRFALTYQLYLIA